MNEGPTRHLRRLATLIALVVGLTCGLWAWLVPARWNFSQWHRNEALAEQASFPARYGDKSLCSAQSCHGKAQAESHKEQYGRVLAGPHATLDCQICHGPLVDHARDGERIKEARKDASGRLCRACHWPTPGRPASLPLHDPTTEEHREARNQDKDCGNCHHPHDPRVDESAKKKNGTVH